MFLNKVKFSCKANFVVFGNLIYAWGNMLHFTLLKHWSYAVKIKPRAFFSESFETSPYYAPQFANFKFFLLHTCIKNQFHKKSLNFLLVFFSIFSWSHYVGNLCFIFKFSCWRLWLYLLICMLLPFDVALLFRNLNTFPILWCLHSLFNNI